MNLWVGTSGYSYKEWKGNFYPEKISAEEMLPYYSERLSAVEINNTFYRLPKTGVLESWSDSVPEQFRFSVKASRRITHNKRLNGVEDETEYLLKTVTVLGERLGVVFFQLPPFLRKDVKRLEAFLNLVDRSVPAAFEFRHESWMDEEVYDCLRAHSAVLSVADNGDGDGDEIVSTADWGYLRLRRPEYSDEQLAKWAHKIVDQAWKHAFVFFKHEHVGAGPALADQFRQVVCSVT